MDDLNLQKTEQPHSVWEEISEYTNTDPQLIKELSKTENKEYFHTIYKFLETADPNFVQNSLNRDIYGIATLLRACASNQFRGRTKVSELNGSSGEYIYVHTISLKDVEFIEVRYKNGIPYIYRIDLN